MDEDATWYGGKPRPRPHCIRRGPQTPSSPRKGHSSRPLFGPCLLWPRSPISTTAELLFLSGVAISVVIFAGLPAGQVPIFFRRSTGRMTGWFSKGYRSGRVTKIWTGSISGPYVPYTSCIYSRLLRFRHTAGLHRNANATLHIYPLVFHRKFAWRCSLELRPVWPQ